MAKDPKEPPKSETIARYAIADLDSNDQWSDFTTKSAAFEEAKQALIDAKKVVREMFREDQNIPDGENIDFSINGNYAVLIHYFEKKQAERPRAPTVTLGQKKTSGVTSLRASPKRQ